MALDTAAVRAAFREKNVAVLRADWTNADQAITDYLARFRRSGVPLYVYYPPGGEPRILPQMLTPAIIKEAL